MTFAFNEQPRTLSHDRSINSKNQVTPRNLQLYLNMSYRGVRIEDEDEKLQERRDAYRRRVWYETHATRFPPNPTVSMIQIVLVPIHHVLNQRLLPWVLGHYSFSQLSTLPFSSFTLWLWVSMLRLRGILT